MYVHYGSSYTNNKNSSNNDNNNVCPLWFII